MVDKSVRGAGQGEQKQMTGRPQATWSAQCHRHEEGHAASYLSGNEIPHRVELTVEEVGLNCAVRFCAGFSSMSSWPLEICWFHSWGFSYKTAFSQSHLQLPNWGLKILFSFLFLI